MLRTLILILFFYSVSALASPNWQLLNDGLNKGHEDITTFTLSPNRPNEMFASTYYNNLYKSTDYGANWQALNFFNGMRIYGVGINPVNGNEIIVSADSHLYKSVDGGEHWQTLNFSDSKLTTIVYNPKNPAEIYITGKTQGKAPLYKTLNAGLSWQELFAPDEFGGCSVTINPQSPENIYYSTLFNFYHSKDSGETWQKMPNVEGDTLPHYFGGKLFYFSNKSFSGLFAGKQWPSSALYSYDENKQKWRLLKSNEVRGDDNQGLPYLVGPDSAKDITTYFPSIGLFRSYDGGLSWSKPETTFNNKNVLSIEASPQNPRILYVPTRSDGLYLQAKDSPGWVNLGKGMFGAKVRKLAIDPKNPANMLVGLEDNGIFISTDGETWQKGDVTNLLRYKPVREILIDPQNSEKIIALVYDNSIRAMHVAISYDGGRNFQFSNVQDPGNDHRFFAQNIIINSDNTNELLALSGVYFVGDEASKWTPYTCIWKSIDGGKSWFETFHLSFDETPKFVKVGNNLKDLIIIANDAPATLYQARNADEGLEKSKSEITKKFVKYYIPNSSVLGSIFAIVKEQGQLFLYQSSDGVKNWKRVTDVPLLDKYSKVKKIYVDPANTKTFYALYGNSIRVSNDSGVSWQPLDPTVKPVNEDAVDLLVQNNVLYVLTEGSGIYTMHL